MGFVTRNGIPERKELTREIERRKKEQAEADAKLRQQQAIRQQQRPAPAQ